MEDGATEFPRELQARHDDQSDCSAASSGMAMSREIDPATVERRNKIVDSFVLVSVIEDPRPSIGTALEILWNSGVKTIGDIRGRRLADLFDGHSLTSLQQKQFAETLHPFGVALD